MGSEDEEYENHEKILEDFLSFPLTERSRLEGEFNDEYLLQMVDNRSSRLIRLRRTGAPTIILSAEKVLILRAVRYLLDEPPVIPREIINGLK